MKTVYITGDTHGDFSQYKIFAEGMHPTEDDVMVVVGDACLNYFADERDEKRKYFVNSFPFTTFCIYGNHEVRPWHIPSYELIDFHGGKAWQEPQYPNIIFAKDGEVYNFDGRFCIVIGGAYSVDKYDRLQWGYRWFEDEQPSEGIKADVERKLDELQWKVDIVLSHTCPLKYEPTETFLQGVNQSEVDNSTEEWLDTIEGRLDYEKWYCGHFHIDKKIDKIQFLYNDITLL